MSHTELIVGNVVRIVCTSGAEYRERVLYVSSDKETVFTLTADAEYCMYFGVRWVSPSCWACYVDGGNETIFSLIQVNDEENEV